VETDLLYVTVCSILYYKLQKWHNPAFVCTGFILE